MANKYIKKKQETLKDQELLKSANELGIDLNKANTDPEYWNNMMDGNIEDLGGSGLDAATQSLDGTVTALMKNAMIPAGYSSGNPIYIGGSRKEITAKDIVEPDTSTAMADTWMDESIASPRHNQSGTITANEDRLKSGEVQTQSNKKVADGIVNSASGSTVAVEKRGHTTTEGEKDDSANKPKLNHNAPNIGLGKMEQDEEEEVDEKKYKDFFQKNILHDYDAVSYNFRLSMLSEADAISAQKWIYEGNTEDKSFRNWVPEQKKIIIAETGSTVLAINDVQINAVAGPINNGKRLTGAVDFQLTIQQPLNATFTDTLVNAAIALGLPDGLKATYLLELKFVGRDPHTGRIVNPIPTTERQFLIEIIAVEASVDANGSTYSVRAARAGDKSLRQKTYQTDRPLQLTNIRTIKDLIGKVAEAMNENEIDKLAIEKGVLDEYYIHLDPFTQKEIGEDEILTTGELEAPTTNKNMDDSEDTNLREFKVPQGTSLDRMLEFGISHSKKLQKLAKGLKDSADADSSDSADIDKFVKHIFHLKVDTVNIEWDIIRNEYAREYHYTISLFPTIRPEISPGVWGMKELVEEEKIKALLGEDISGGKSRPYKAMCKRYDYLFTGLNDKVLRFDIKYNNQFFFALHSYRGLYSKLDSGTQDRIQKSAETLAQFREQQKEVTSAWKKYLKFKAETLTLDPEGTEQTRGTLWNNFESERTKLLNLYSDGIEDGTFEGDLALADRLRNNQQDDPTSGQELFETPKNSPETFINPDDVKDYAELINRQTLIKEISDPKKNGFQVMWGAVPDDFRNKFNSTGETPGKGHFDSVIEASLSDFEADLVAMDMDIKGDPFWLESERDPKFTRSMSMYEGENYLLFRAITSAGEPDPATGLANPNRADNKEQMLNGVYAVVQILNSFSGGQFTQNIKGVKEAFITDISILEQYEEELPYIPVTEE